MTDRAPVDQSDDGLRPFRNFVERCRGDHAHVEQVRALAISLFDQLGEKLGSAPEERRLLEAASLLHDVGQLVSYRQHHKHSAQLIMHAEHLPLLPRELAVVAQVSRYHRKSGPQMKHEEFAGLPAEDRAVVRRLAAILRVADGLDRGHTAAVGAVNAILLDDRCVIRAQPAREGGDLALELWSAERKSDVLEKELGRSVQVAAANG